MTTKAEIQNKARGEILKAQTELNKFEQEHKKFEQEHKKREEYNYKRNILDEKIGIFISKKWVGNFEKHNNWYYSKIPFKFESLISKDKEHEDKNLICDILKELSIKQEKEIIQTKEYKDLEEERKKLIIYSFSQKHILIDEKIENLKHKIDWENRLINRMENKGELIQYAKGLKKGEERERQQKETEKRKQKLKEKILKLNKEYK